MPFFQFYPSDFLASGKVAAMDTVEVGAHLLLMCQAWLGDPPATIPDDDFILSRWARMTVETWAGCKPRVLAAWELSGGRWVQPRLAAEWEKASANSQALSEAGRKGNAKRWGGDRVAIAGRSQGDRNPDPETDGNTKSKAVKSLKVSVGVRRELDGCVDLTVGEITEVFSVIKAKKAGGERIGDVDAVVAAELLRRRGKQMPRKAGPMSGSLSVAVMANGGPLANIENIRRNRGL